MSKTMIIGKIISIGKNDSYHPFEKDLIGKEVKFDLVNTKHFGSEWRGGSFYATKEINFGRFRRVLEGELILFSRVKVKIVKK